VSIKLFIWYNLEDKYANSINISGQEGLMIAIGSDHAAYGFKMEIIKHLEEKGILCRDYGADGKVKSEYPEYAQIVAKAVQSGECEKGILFCGTGIGMSIAANKIEGIRAAVCMESFGAELSRMHNNANILCLGARMLGLELAKKIVDVWLSTEFQGGRHKERVDMIARIERGEDLL
jgi:ribose 5-phosphate isomerase B